MRLSRCAGSLDDAGTYAGPETILWHLCERHGTSPSPSTIYRCLSRRGFITPEPRKHPKVSYVRFQADLPNECWQGDMTHWQFADSTEVEIPDFIDDHSRAIVAADSRAVTKGPNVLVTFEKAVKTWGTPVSVLTDKGAIFNEVSRQGRTAFEYELLGLNILYQHSRPYHPPEKRTRQQSGKRADDTCQSSPCAR